MIQHRNFEMLNLFHFHVFLMVVYSKHMSRVSEVATSPKTIPATRPKTLPL